MNRLRRISRQLRDGWAVAQAGDVLRFLHAWLRYEVLSRRPEYQLSTPWARFPVTLRRGTSDYLVFLQIFVLREYAMLDGLANVDLVIDCGANVGCSAAYFLSRFPRARIIAVESDSANFSLLERNLAPYGERATAIHAAIWSHDGWVHSHESRYRDGKEWTRQVRATEVNETGDVKAISLNNLIGSTGRRRVSVLKMDIEGAEVAILRDTVSAWLDHIDALAIELHDDTQFGPATPVFERALSGQPFSITSHGELTLCRRVAAGASGAGSAGLSRRAGT